METKKITFENEKELKDLKKYLEYLSPEQVSFLREIVSIWTRGARKTDLIKLGNLDNGHPYDTATPQPYMERIFELYPEAKKGHYIYQYHANAGFGHLVNINNAIIERLIKLS